MYQTIRLPRPGMSTVSKRGALKLKSSAPDLVGILNVRRTAASISLYGPTVWATASDRTGTVANNKASRIAAGKKRVFLA